MKRTTIARCAVACVVLFGLFRIHQCAQDQDKHWDGVHEAEAKEKRERATERAATEAAQKRFEEGPVAGPGLDPAEVARLTADRQSALKLYHSIDRILGRAAWSFAEGRHGYCEFYVDTVVGIHLEHTEDAEKLLLTVPATDEEELARDRKLEESGNKFIAYEEHVAACEAGIETGTLQMPSKVDLETRRYQAKREIAEIDRRLTNPPSVPEPSTQTPQSERPVDTSQSIVTQQPSASIGAPAPESGAPAPPAEVAKPTSGVLCNGPVEVRQNWEFVFRNLPGGQLRFTFDHDAWLPILSREPDGTQTLIMRSIKPGVQTMCDIRWEVVQ
jgi:hypothetical protein